MANHNLSRVILLGGLSMKLKPPKNYMYGVKTTRDSDASHEEY